ncbi:hypothetical protein FOZ63_002156, partial [Perkinsus olseni]
CFKSARVRAGGASGKWYFRTVFWRGSEAHSDCVQRCSDVRRTASVEVTIFESFRARYGT